MVDDSIAKRTKILNTGLTKDMLSITITESSPQALTAPPSAVTSRYCNSPASPTPGPGSSDGLLRVPENTWKRPKTKKPKENATREKVGNAPSQAQGAVLHCSQEELDGGLSLFAFPTDMPPEETLLPTLDVPRERGSRKRVSSFSTRQPERTPPGSKSNRL